MEETAPAGQLTRPRSDDRALWDVSHSFYGYPAIFIAHKVGLFRTLGERPKTLSDVCEALGVKPRPADLLLTAATALGFLALDDGTYSLTPVAEDYLLETSPTYFGFFLDLLGGNTELVSFAGLERAVMTDSAQAFGNDDHLFASPDVQAEQARAFTRGMHGISIAAGLAWPDLLDLSQQRVMLDVGGGSGAHSIGAVSRWPHLRAIVFDIAPVCEVADEFIVRQRLAERIETKAGDMWEDELPAADLHFYANIFHDWSEEKGRLLADRSFASLPAGGRIVLHEMLYDDDKRGPFRMAGYSMGMLGWSVDGKQYSGRELSATLAGAGFRNLETIPAFGYNSLVVGTKP
jgi:hypothetical protein